MYESDGIGLTHRSRSASPQHCHSISYAETVQGRVIGRQHQYTSRMSRFFLMIVCMKSIDIS